MKKPVGKLKDMQRLSELLDMSYKAKRLEVEAFRKRLARVEALLADLDRAIARRSATRGGSDDAAMKAGADVAWMVWIEQRKILLNTERLRLVNEISARQDRLAREFGRKEIASKMHARARQAKAM